MTSQPPSLIPGSRLRRGTQVAGVTLDELIVRGERIHAWRGHRADGSLVTVHALIDHARPREVEHFLEAARRLAALSRNPVAGVVDVMVVAPNERLYVARGSAAGTMEDVGLLGWGLRDSLTFIRRLCRAMREVHRHNLVHGCARPANVLLDDNLDPRLSDVGAVVLDDSYDGPSDAAHDYAAYAAREVRQGEVASVRSDVFSLGRLIAHVLAGEAPPLDAAAVPELAYLEQQPEGLVRIVRKATLADPHARYGSVDELMADLEYYEQAERVGVASLTVEARRDRSTAQASEERPSWRPGDLRRRARTPREMPPRAAAPSVSEMPRRGAATPLGLAPRRQAPTPREIPRRGAATPREIPRRGSATPSEAPASSKTPARPQWKGYHSAPPPPPEEADFLSPRQARLAGGLGALVLLTALGFSWFSATSTPVALAGAMIGASGASLLMPPVGSPWISRLAAAAVLAVVTFWLDPVSAVAIAGRRSKLEQGSPLERGRRLAQMRSRGIRDFAHIDLSGADFTGLDLTATVFDQANLRAARFNRAQLSGVSFDDADLTATDFGGADLSGVDVASSKGWRESRCDDATVMPAGWGCDDDGRPAPLSPLAP